LRPFIRLYVSKPRTTTHGSLDRLAIQNHHRRTGFSSGMTTSLLVERAV
jgi:hypothetical protein